MNNGRINSKFRRATIWSAITQVFSKAISPMTNMLLARVLAPESFGIIAMVNMVITFTDIFTDVGFQKYLVQHEFANLEDKNKNANVAFWTNLFVSLFLWFIIVVFRKSIASAVGNPGLGDVIGVACLQLPVTSFSSIQLAIYRRDFDFRSLFVVRLIGALIPLFVTIPLALLGLDYWSLIIGQICGSMTSAIILTLKSAWKPGFYYSFSILGEMLSFSIWSLLESLSIWFTAWVDVFIIGGTFSDYHIGIYKSSLNLVNSLMAIVTSSVTPILFTSLSRLQNDQTSFNRMFLNVHRGIAYLIFPMGVGLFLYRELATDIMLGPQWEGASNIIGLWALASAVRIVMTSIYSEAYRAKGKPKLSLLLQIFDLVFLVPVILIYREKGFWEVVYARTLMRLDLILPGLFVMGKIMQIGSKSLLSNIIKPLIGTLIMFISSLILKSFSNSVLSDLISILLCALIYSVVITAIDRNIRGNLRKILSGVKLKSISLR